MTSHRQTTLGDPGIGHRPYRSDRRSSGTDPIEPLERQRWRAARDAIRNVFELAVGTVTPRPAMSVTV